MRFVATPIAGAFVLEQERHGDERGWFARTFCARELEEHGLNGRVAQASVSFNNRRGTVRGMHWQAEPAAETKLVRVTRGAIHDVIVDLRPESPSYMESFAVELDDRSGDALYVPELCAHGFQTLADDTEVDYQISEFFSPSDGRGFRWDDPAFAISWPLPISLISDRDRSWPDFAVAAPAAARL